MKPSQWIAGSAGIAVDFQNDLIFFIELYIIGFVEYINLKQEEVKLK